MVPEGLPASHPVPSPLAWVVAVFAVLVQHSAFVDLAMMRVTEANVSVVNPLNTTFVALSFASIAIASLFVSQRMMHLAARNKAILAYLCLVVISIAWSIHPDITLRRSTGCILSIMVAAYIAVRFGDRDRMKVFSYAFAISAIGSLFYIVAYPEYGITPVQDYGGTAGSWRGIFPQKNVLGGVMSVAIFVEFYLLVAGRGRPLWRYGLLGIYFVLLIFSRSATSMLCTAVYLAGLITYLIARRDKLIGAAVMVILATLFVLVQFELWYDPELLLGLIGKDTTLTGRTDLWVAIPELIGQRPLLGAGYMATWLPTDPNTVGMQRIFGWAAPNAHNAFIDITLQLGLLGLGLLLAVIVTAWHRAVRCCARGILPLGWFSLIFIVGTLVLSVTESGLGETQSINWVLLITLSLSCGLGLSAIGKATVANKIALLSPQGTPRSQMI